MATTITERNGSNTWGLINNCRTCLHIFGASLVIFLALGAITAINQGTAPLPPLSQLTPLQGAFYFTSPTIFIGGLVVLACINCVKAAQCKIECDRGKQKARVELETDRL